MNMNKVTTHAPDTSGNFNSIFKIRDSSHLDCKMFLDESGTTDISRFDVVKYDILLKQTNLMNAAFWKPTEINMTQDRIDFHNKLEPHEQHIFTSNIKSQIMGDSLLGRSQAEALLPLVSLPEVEGGINTISYFENQIHSLSYTHILRGVYNNPSEVFDSMKGVPEIVNRVQLTTKYADALIEYTYKYKLGIATDIKYLKRLLYLYLVSVNLLEGLQFRISFDCSFNFGENKRMSGSADINRLIANDESLHLAFNTTILKLLPSDDPDFVDIIKSAKDEASHIYNQGILQEKNWVTYLFQYGSMMGMNQEILNAELDYIGKKNMDRIGLDFEGTVVTNNPLPWTKAYLNEESVQKPPQETDITGYLKNTKGDLDLNSFKDFEL